MDPDQDGGHIEDFFRELEGERAERLEVIDTLQYELNHLRETLRRLEVLLREGWAPTAESRGFCLYDDDCEPGYQQQAHSDTLPEAINAAWAMREEG